MSGGERWYFANHGAHCAPIEHVGLLLDVQLQHFGAEVLWEAVVDDLVQELVHQRDVLHDLVLCDFDAEVRLEKRHQLRGELEAHRHVGVGAAHEHHINVIVPEVREVRPSRYRADGRRAALL